MPSVYATWSGRCPDRRRRDAICTRVDEVADLSDAMMDRQTRLRHDMDLGPGVLAAEGLFPPQAVRLIEPGLVELPSAHLHGVEFRLSDPRNLYPGDDRVSFVFASLTDGESGAQGCLVLIEDQAQCARYENPLIQNAQRYLAEPSVHLRYFAEGWIDSLLAFLRRFHMPELRYWRYDDLPGSHQFDRVALTDEPGRERAWRGVKSRLFDELSEWIPKGEELGAMRDHLRYTGRLPPRWFSKSHEELEMKIELSSDVGEVERAEMLRLLLFGQSEFEALARRAIYASGKGLDLSYVPVTFNGARFALRSRLDADGEQLTVEVRLALDGAPDHVIATRDDGGGD